MSVDFSLHCSALLCFRRGRVLVWDVVALCVRYIHRDGILSEAKRAIELLAWHSVDRSGGGF